MDITITNIVYGMCILLLILIIVFALMAKYKMARNKSCSVGYVLSSNIPDNNYSMTFDTVVVPDESSLTNELLSKYLLYKASKKTYNKALPLYKYNMIDIGNFNGYLVDDKGNYYSDNNVSIFPLEMALKLPDRVSAHYLRPELTRTQPYA